MSRWLVGEVMFWFTQRWNSEREAMMLYSVLLEMVVNSSCVSVRATEGPRPHRVWSVDILLPCPVKST